ncbi:hypothetical protein EYF80_031272 [Liparis tanakae]|uniref:Uncharacterized protein n=1 Tax=Liparis tanakae TaxID=230148 RepID=A0A4Z2GYE2_9TELE|nr:hypothetical protein EYF80_031272 [Liparis tanakae]
MELLHVGVNVAEHCELLWGNLIRRERSSTNTADPSDTSNATDTTNTSNHSTHTTTRRGHLLQHRTRRHLHTWVVTLRNHKVAPLSSMSLTPASGVEGGAVSLRDRVVPDPSATIVFLVPAGIYQSWVKGSPNQKLCRAHLDHPSLLLRRTTGPKWSYHYPQIAHLLPTCLHMEIDDRGVAPTPRDLGDRARAPARALVLILGWWSSTSNIRPAVPASLNGTSLWLLAL